MAETSPWPMSACDPKRTLAPTVFSEVSVRAIREPNATLRRSEVMKRIPKTSPCREARQRGSLAPRGSRSVARHCANSARQDEARRNRPETVPNPENYPSQNGWRSACPRQWLPARCSPSRADPRYPPDLPKSLFAAGGTRMKLPDPFHQPSNAFLDLYSEHVA